MRHLFISLLTLCTALALYGQGGSGPATDPYYFYIDNLAAPAPAGGHNVLLGQTELIDVLNSIPDLTICEKQILDLGVTSIGTSTNMAIYHFDVNANGGNLPQPLPSQTNVGANYNGWVRLGTGNVNNNFHLTDQPAAGIHYYVLAVMATGNINVTENWFSYGKVEVDEPLTITTTPACFDGSITVTAAGCAVDAAARYSTTGGGMQTVTYDIAWSNGQSNLSTPSTTYYPPHQATGSVAVTYLIKKGTGVGNPDVYYTLNETFALNTENPVPPTIIGNNTMCDNSNLYTIGNYQAGYVYTVTVSHGTATSPNANGEFAVNWQNFPNPGTATITVTAVTPNNCTTAVSMAVASCCNGSVVNGLQPIVFTNTTASQMLQTTNFTNVNRQIVMNGVITIDQDLTISGCDHIKMAPNAEIIVSPSKKLTIVNSKLKADECGYMWKGIVLPDPTANIEVKQYSEIWHAKNAVWAKQNADVNLTESKFYNNHVGLRLTDLEPKEEPIAVPQSANTSIIYANHFRKIGNYLPSDILPLKTPSIGIVTDNIYMLNIGQAGQIQNLFEDLKTGISATNSYIIAVNNNFKNLGIRGIYFANKLIINSNGQVLYRVYSHLKAINNNFYGIMVNAIYGTGRLEAEGNDFENYSGLNTATVWVRELNQNSYIKNNTFNPKNGSQNVNMLATAIKLERAAAPFKGMKLDVENNIINRYRSGIELTNTQGYVGSSQASLYAQVKVYDNDIYNPNLAANQGMLYGIRLQHANGANVVYNEIERLGNTTTSSGRATFERGIALSQTQNAQVVYNNVKKHGNGIWSAGNLKGTFYGCNLLDATYYGFYFLPPSSTSNTVISTQGNSTFPTGNQWFDPASTVGAFDRVAGQVDAGPIRYPKWYFNQGATTDAEIWITGDPTKISGQQLSFPHPPGCGSFKWWGEPAYLATYREMELEELVRNERQYQQLQEEFEQFGEEYIYNLLTVNPEIMDTDVPADDELYTNWMDSISATNIGQFYAIMEALDSGNITAAIMLNAQIQPENVIESNRKTVNYYYLTKYAQGIELGTEDSLSLAPIALQTPYVGGDAVFGARVMLGIDPDDYGMAYKGEVDMGQEIGDAYRIYPNPARDVLNVELLDQTFTSDSKIVLLDLAGRVMLQTTSEDIARNVSLPIAHLTNGVYILQVLNGTEILLTERVIINK